MTGIDDRLKYPAGLLEDCLLHCESKKERKAALARFRRYRDAHGLDFPDEIIEINEAEDRREITHEQANRLRRAFHASRSEKEDA